MHTIQLKIDNSIYDKIMFFLDSLKHKGIEITETQTLDDDKKLNSFYAIDGCVDGLFENKSIQSIKANMHE